MPHDWPQFEITYRYRSATYHITVANPRGTGRGVQSVSVDGTPQDDRSIALADDGRRHTVCVVLRPHRPLEESHANPSERIGAA